MAASKLQMNLDFYFGGISPRAPLFRMIIEGKSINPDDGELNPNRPVPGQAAEIHPMVQRIPAQHSAKTAFAAALQYFPGPAAAAPFATAPPPKCVLANTERSPAEKSDFAAPVDITSFPVHRQKIRQVAVISAGGAQGALFAAQVLKNAEREDYGVSLQVRNPAAFRRNARVRCGSHAIDIAEHPRAQVVTGFLETDPSTTLIIDPTVASGLADTIACTPSGSSVAYTQNGVPSHQREKSEKALDIHTLISLITSTRAPGQGITVMPGGKLFTDENDKCIDAWHLILGNQGFFTLENVADIQAVQYEKIALNCALNVTATLFGKTLGALKQLAGKDPRCEKLVGGLAGEVCAVASAQGIRVKPTDQIVADIHAAMGRFPRHPTSMRAAFDAGATTEIAVLNAAVSALGRELGIATPLNDLVAQRLAWMERMRDESGAAADFHERHRETVARWTEEILEMAATLA